MYDFGDYSEYANEFLEDNPIPESTIESLQRWVLYGTPTGDFLNAVLEDKLTDAVCRADRENGAALKRIAIFVYNCLPAGCRDRKTWQAHRGLSGGI